MTAPDGDPVPTGTDITPDFIKEALGFTLAVEFPSFETDGAGIVSFHDELERLGNDYGWDNVIGSLFHENTALSLGVFVRNTVIPSDPND